MQSISHYSDCAPAIWVIVLIYQFLFIPTIVSQGSEEVPASGKKRRQVFREDVSPLLGGKVPSAAFDWTRLMFNNLDSRGISIPDGTYPSSDRNSDGRSDEKRLMLFSSDGLSPNIPSTYTLRNPVEYPLYPNPDEKPESLDDVEEEREIQSNYRCQPDDEQCHLYGYENEKVTRSNYDGPQFQKHFLSNDDEHNIRVEMNGNFPYMKHSNELHNHHQHRYNQPLPFLFNKYRPMEIHVFPRALSDNSGYQSRHHHPQALLDHILYLKTTSSASAYLPTYILIAASNSKSTPSTQTSKNKSGNGKYALLSMKGILREVLQRPKYSV